MLGPGWPCPAVEGAFLVLLAPLLPGPPPFSSLAALPACLQTPLLPWSRPGHCCAHALHLLGTVCGHTGPSVRWAGGVGDTACVGEGLHLEAGCRGEECEDGGQGGGRGLGSWHWREGFAEEGQGSWASGSPSRRRRGVPRGGREGAEKGSFLVCPPSLHHCRPAGSRRVSVGATVRRFSAGVFP